MSAIVLKEGLVHYEAIGRGRPWPVVFIHGWLGSWRYWVPAMEELSVDRRVYALDLWGFGDSDKTHMHYNIQAYVTLLKEFLYEMGVDKVSLVGHALGGLVALSFAAQYGEQVERVMAVSVPIIDSDIKSRLASFSGNGDELERLVTRQANFPEVDMEAHKADAKAIISSMRSVRDHDLRTLSFPSQLPILLVHGKADPLVDPPSSRSVRSFAQNMRMMFLKGARHFPMLEERNKFNRLLKSFLEAGDDLDSLELKDEWHRRLR